MVVRIAAIRRNVGVRMANVILPPSTVEAATFGSHAPFNVRATFGVAGRT
jgi:hypothetical protein